MILIYCSLFECSFVVNPCTFGYIVPHTCVRDIPAAVCTTFSLQEGYTPLIVASRHGHVECVKVLLDRGAQTNLQDKGVQFRDGYMAFGKVCTS